MDFERVGISSPKSALVKRLLFLAVAAGMNVCVNAQPGITGKWKTIDDTSGQPRSIIELFERSGKYYARVVKIYSNPGEDPDPICNQCPKDDSRYNQKIIGMEVLKDMVNSQGALADGHILDPENGKIYRCRVWLEDEILKVRGYWGPFYRTQSWHKVP